MKTFKIYLVVLWIWIRSYFKFWLSVIMSIRCLRLVRMRLWHVWVRFVGRLTNLNVHLCFGYLISIVQIISNLRR